jgi:hypothetical protein
MAACVAGIDATAYDGKYARFATGSMTTAVATWWPASVSTASSRGFPDMEKGSPLFRI